MARTEPRMSDMVRPWPRYSSKMGVEKSAGAKAGERKVSLGRPRRNDGERDKATHR